MGDKYPSDWDSRRKKVYQRDNHTCQKCGKKGGHRESAELHAHHKTPISQGGGHEYSNLTTLCQSCHSDVHGRPVGGKSSSASDSDTSSYGWGSQSDGIGSVVALGILVSGIVLIAVYIKAVNTLFTTGTALFVTYSVVISPIFGKASLNLYRKGELKPKNDVSELVKMGIGVCIATWVVFWLFADFYGANFWKASLFHLLMVTIVWSIIIPNRKAKKKLTRITN